MESARLRPIRDYWMTLATERVAVECEIERYFVLVSGKRSERRIDGTESARGMPAKKPSGGIEFSFAPCARCVISGGTRLRGMRLEEVSGQSLNFLEAPRAERG